MVELIRFQCVESSIPVGEFLYEIDHDLMVVDIDDVGFVFVH